MQTPPGGREIAPMFFGRMDDIRAGLQAGDTVVGAGSFYLKTALLRERIGDEH